MTFMDDYRAGLATRDDLSDHLSAWWKKNEGLALRDYLGMTEREWRTFVNRDELPARRETQ